MMLFSSKINGCTLWCQMICSLEIVYSSMSSYLAEQLHIGCTWIPWDHFHGMEINILPLMMVLHLLNRCSWPLSLKFPGRRIKERGTETENGTWDVFLHCRNENVPAFLCPGTAFPERGTQGRYRSPCSWPFASCNMVLTSCEKIVCLEDGLPEDLKETWLECTDDVASLFSPGSLHPPLCCFRLVASVGDIVHRVLTILSVDPI